VKRRTRRVRSDCKDWRVLTLPALKDQVMNTDQLKKQVGQLMKLRPLPLRIGYRGEDLGPSDDDWSLVEVTTKPKAAVLRNTATGHAVTLQADNVREFRSPHHLILRCLLIMRGREIIIEPIVGQ